MSKAALLGFEENIPRLRAEEMLQRLRENPGLSVTADGMKALVLAATGDRRQAEEAWKAHVEAALIAGRTPK